ncbi:MAG: hypothetical protein ACLUEJ_10775 [Clostridium sp.]
MGLESLKNESLCLEIQAGGKNVDLCLAQLLRNNAEEFAQWAKEAVAEALKKEAAMSPDELMGEAMRGFRRAAETYKPETHTDFITGAEFWVKQCVRSYVRRAERKELPERMLDSVAEYRRIMDRLQYDPAAGKTLRGDELMAFLGGIAELVAPGREVDAVGCGV